MPNGLTSTLRWDTSSKQDFPCTHRTITAQFGNYPVLNEKTNIAHHIALFRRYGMGK
jgi:hypothetical protein